MLRLRNETDLPLSLDPVHLSSSLPSAHQCVCEAPDALHRGRLHHQERLWVSLQSALEFYRRTKQIGYISVYPVLVTYRASVQPRAKQKAPELKAQADALPCPTVMLLCAPILFFSCVISIVCTVGDVFISSICQYFFGIP